MGTSKTASRPTQEQQAVDAFFDLIVLPAVVAMGGYVVYRYVTDPAPQPAPPPARGPG